MSAIVIVPTYNERDNLQELTDRLLRLNLALDVVVVDDAFSDGTGTVADAQAAACPQVSATHREAVHGQPTPTPRPRPRSTASALASAESRAIGSAASPAALQREAMTLMGNREGVASERWDVASQFQLTMGLTPHAP